MSGIVLNQIVSIYQGQEKVPTEKGNLYLSSIGSLNQGPDLDAANIKTILSVIDEWAYQHYKVQNKIQHLQLNHKWISLQDDQQNDIYPILNDAIAFIKQSLSQHNVLVHCQAGISRSASVVIAFLMKQQGMTYQQAFAHTKKRRPRVQPNNKFAAELKNYEMQLLSQKESEKKQQQ